MLTVADAVLSNLVVTVEKLVFTVTLDSLFKLGIYCRFSLQLDCLPND